MQPLFNVVIHNPKSNRVSRLTGGEEDGEDIFEKPIIIGFTETGRICIEKNNTDSIKSLLRIVGRDRFR